MRLDNKLNGSAAKVICSLSERATIIAFNEAKAVREVRLRGSPIARLVDSGRIGGDELRAAQDIESAFMAISGGLFMKPLNMERVDGGRGNPDWPHALAKIVGQYQDWANFWSDRRKQHLDYTLEITIAAVIDERHVRPIAEDMGFSERKVKDAIVGGLRDYAARTQSIDSSIAAKWRAAALLTFRRSSGQHVGE